MNRSAIGYIVSLQGSNEPPMVAKCVIDDNPEGTRILVDDGSGGHWYPRDGFGQATESDDGMTLSYGTSSHFGESGIIVGPVTVERWNALAAKRPEMIPVADFDELETMMRW